MTRRYFLKSLVAAGILPLLLTEVVVANPLPKRRVVTLHFPTLIKSTITFFKEVPSSGFFGPWYKECSHSEIKAGDKAIVIQENKFSDGLALFFKVDWIEGSKDFSVYSWSRKAESP